MLERLIDQGRDRARARLRQAPGAEAIAIAGTLDLRRRPALDEDEGGEQAAPRIGSEVAAADAVDPPVEHGHG